MNENDKAFERYMEIMGQEQSERALIDLLIRSGTERTEAFNMVMGFVGAL